MIASDPPWAIGGDVLSQLPLPTGSTVRYHLNEVEQILQSVQDGVYCAVLGPRLSGKTELLLYTEDVLETVYGWPTVYIDLMLMAERQLRSSSLQGFFAELMRLVAEHLTQLTGAYLPFPDAESASSSVFRAFLSDTASNLERDLVLIIEHLEALPLDLVQALLTSLRASYMDQQDQDQFIMVVVSGALSLATLTVGESSPFRGIARRVFINDLSEKDSLDLILEYINSTGLKLTERARQELLHATCGDPYLIRTLCQRGSELARSLDITRLSVGNIHRMTNEFLRNEVFQYAPLLEAVRLIEEDPDLLRCILLLLDREIVQKSDLPLPLSPDLDPLYLTGVVEVDEDNCYRLQNSIYRQFLRTYFAPGRVGHLLALTGRWEQALDNLELAVRLGEIQSRTDLLPSIINSIYGSQDLRQAAYFVVRGLAAAFGVSEARVWYAPPQENSLRLIVQWARQNNAEGASTSDTLWANPEIPINADRLEARAFRQAAALRGQDSSLAGDQVLQAIPLSIPGQKPVGIVTVVDDHPQRSFQDQRERDLQLLSFLRPAARALYTVSLRRQELMLAGRLQMSLLPDAPPQPDGWQFCVTWRPARETAGDFYDFIPLPGNRLGFVIADVADKGMGAALYMALSRTLLRTFAMEFSERPDQVLHAASTRMLMDAATGHFVTAFYGILDVTSGRLVYCNAGHNPPLLVNPALRDAVQPLHKTGPALGVMGDASWRQAEITISPGALLLLYTDGLIDAQNHHRQFFGEGRTLEILSQLYKPSAQDVQDALISGVRAFTGDEPQYDDITLMVILRNR